MSKKTPSQDFNYKFEHHWGGERTKIQKIKGWIKKQKPPFNKILMHLFSYIEVWYWEGKVIQTMTGVDAEVDKIHELWDNEHSTKPTVEEGPSSVSDLPTLRIRNPVVERGTEESGTSVAPPSTKIQIPDPWD